MIKPFTEVNYRHRPHKDKRSRPSAVDIQQLVKDLRTIVPEGVYPDVKMSFVCNYCGSGKSYMYDHDLWLDTYSPVTVVDITCFYCSMDLAEGLPV